MLKEMIDRLASLGVEAKRNIIVTPQGEPAHVYGVINPNTGAISWVNAQPAPLDATAISIIGLVRALKAHMNIKPTEIEPDDSEPVPVIWYSRNAIVGVVSRRDRRDRITLPLTYSDQMEQLNDWNASPENIKQADLVFLLRTTFKNNMDRAGKLLDVVRKIRWESDASAESEILHGKASVGKQLRQEARGLDAIPEYTTLTVPVFDSAELSAKTFPVECAFEPDAGTSTFSIIPLPGEVERAKAFAEAEVAAIIMDSLKQEGLAGVPVLHGNCNLKSI